MAPGRDPRLEAYLLQLESPEPAGALALAQRLPEVIDLTGDDEIKSLVDQIKRLVGEKAAAVEATEAAERRAVQAEEAAERRTAELDARIAQQETDLTAERARTVDAEAKRKEAERRAAAAADQAAAVELRAKEAELSVKKAKSEKWVEIEAARCKAMQEGADEAKAEATASIDAANQVKERAMKMLKEPRAKGETQGKELTKLREKLAAAAAARETEAERLKAEAAVPWEAEVQRLAADLDKLKADNAALKKVAAEKDKEAKEAIEHLHEMDPVMEQAMNYKDERDLARGEVNKLRGEANELRVAAKGAAGAQAGARQVKLELLAKIRALKDRLKDADAKNERLQRQLAAAAPPRDSAGGVRRQSGAGGGVPAAPLRGLSQEEMEEGEVRRPR